jgi:hypothetical protein
MERFCTESPESASPGLIAQSNRLRISNLVTFSTDQPAPKVRKNQIKDKFSLEMRDSTNEGKTTLCFGKEGALRGREFEDQLHTFSCLALLHNAVVAWNTLQIGSIVDQLRREGENVEESDIALTSPLLRRHLNPFGRYHFDLERLRRES